MMNREPHAYIAIRIEFANPSVLRSICKIGCAVYAQGEFTGSREYTVKPDIADSEWDNFAVRSHGITPKDVANGIDFEAAISELFDDLNGNVIAYHGGSERRVIESLFGDYERAFMPAGFIDTQKVAAEVRRNGAGNSLIELRDRYRIPVAAADALSRAEICAALLNRFLSTSQSSIAHWVEYDLKASAKTAPVSSWQEAGRK